MQQQSQGSSQGPRQEGQGPRAHSNEGQMLSAPPTRKHSVHGSAAASPRGVRMSLGSPRCWAARGQLIVQRARPRLRVLQVQAHKQPPELFRCELTTSYCSRGGFPTPLSGLVRNQSGT